MKYIFETKEEIMEFSKKELLMVEKKDLSSYANLFDKELDNLTQIEGKIFSLLRSNKFMSKAEIKAGVYSDGTHVGLKTLDVHLFNLRKKIKPRYFIQHYAGAYFLRNSKEGLGEISV